MKDGSSSPRHGKSASELVPSEEFDTREFIPEERLAAFARLISPLFDVWAQGDPLAFDVQAKGHRVGPFVFNQVDYNSPARFLRRAEHCRGDGSDFLVLEALLAGEQRLIMPKNQVRCHAGHIYLRDWAHEFDAYASTMRLKSMVIPRHLLKASADMSETNPVLSWSLAEPDGRMLSLLWTSMLDEFDRVPPMKAEALCAAFVGYLDGLLGHTITSTPEATLGAMQQYLNARLQGSVSAEELCRHFSISRSKLYRAFEPLGGVKQYITQARLERCFTELLVANPEEVKVNDVAHSWGFNEASSFTRSFRKRFNTAPSEVLGMAHNIEANTEIGNHISDTAYCRNYLGWLQEASGQTPEFKF
ncbi:MAG: helix-turn-helix domain-containing protein [Pseudomonadota bacterium]